MGDPTEEGRHIGPLASEAQFNRVRSLIQTGLDEGARLPAGRTRHFETGWFVKPTVFADVRNDMTIAREEIFGPVLSIIPFGGDADAICVPDDTDYGLAAYVQTGSAAHARRMVGALHAGNVAFNGRSTVHGAPIGGYKQSGNGREGGMFGLEEYLEIKVSPSLDKLEDAGAFTAP